MGEVSIDRWGVNGKTGGVGELWAFAGVMFKWNQVCCGTSKRGHFCKKMGGQVCESVSCSACDLDVFGILVFGPQTRNLHPGGSARGGLESGEWQCRGPEGGGTGGGARMGCLSFVLSLSLLFASCSLSPSLCMCSAAPAVCLPTHSLRVTQAGGSRDHFCTPAQPGRVKPARGTCRSEADWDRRPIWQRFSGEFFLKSTQSF